MRKSFPAYWHRFVLLFTDLTEMLFAYLFRYLKANHQLCTLTGFVAIAITSGKIYTSRT
jgi:hypothetical protein